MVSLRFAVGFMLLLLAVAHIQACKFSHSCTDIKFYGNTMYAICSTSSGNRVKSSIDVDKCVGNYYGQLVCSSGGFTGTCSDIQYNGLTMAAVCKTSKYGEETLFSNRALDDCISNVEGTLQCC